MSAGAQVPTHSIRRRHTLSSNAQMQYARLDGLMPGLEDRAMKAAGSANGQAEVELYQTKKRMFDLKC